MSETSKPNKIMTCPRCGHKIFKLRRKGINKLVGPFVRTRKFECSNAQCSYKTVLLTKKPSKFINLFPPNSPLRNKLIIFFVIIFVMIAGYFMINMLINHIPATPKVEKI